MAKASTITEKVEKVVKVEEKRFILSLDEQEAQALVALLRRVSGLIRNKDGTLAVRGVLTDGILPSLQAQVGRFDLSGPDTLHIPDHATIDKVESYW